MKIKFFLKVPSKVTLTIYEKHLHWLQNAVIATFSNHSKKTITVTKTHSPLEK